MDTAYKCCLLSRPRRFHSRNTQPPPDAPPPPEDVGALFSLHASGALHMNEDGLRRCLGANQGGGEGEGEGLDDDTNDVERLLEQIRGTGVISRQLFTLDDFHRILFFHDLNPPIRHHERVHHNMTLPLSHYFIYSGHNPYYATPPVDQRRGSGGGRSDEPIIRALKTGVRAIEVAMWPNSRENDIKIHHGWTHNTPILLTECLKSIKEYAFVASPYPVIITLEDNLPTSKLQKKAAKVMLDVLGDILYWPHTYHVDVRGNADTSNPLKEFPSPEELKGRVLLSTKPPSPITKKEKAKPLVVYESKDDDGATEQGDEWGAEVPDFQTETQQPAKKHDGDASGSGHQRRHNDENNDEDQKEQKMQPHEYPLYRHLITIRPEKKKTHKGEPVPKVLPGGRLETNKTIDIAERLLIISKRNKTIERKLTLLGPFEKKLTIEAPMMPRTIERVSTLPNELVPLQGEPAAPLLPGRRGGLKTIKTIERVSTLQNEPGLHGPNLKANQTKEIEKVIVDALHSEPGKVRRLSWSKQQTEKAAKYGGTDIVRFTQRNILRIYPSFSTRPTHLTSSNYNPFLGWVHGAQMVALNLQVYGRVFWLMHGFFRANGGCGYEYGRDLSLIHGFRRACKPDFLMQTEPTEVFDPRERKLVKKILKNVMQTEPAEIFDPRERQLVKELKKVMQTEPTEVFDPRELQLVKEIFKKVMEIEPTEVFDLRNLQLVKKILKKVMQIELAEVFDPRELQFVKEILNKVKQTESVQVFDPRECQLVKEILKKVMQIEPAEIFDPRECQLVKEFLKKVDLVMQTEPAEVFDPRECQPVKKTLKVKVYMGDGWFMDFKHAHTFIPDMWTSVGIAGVRADTTAMQNTKATEKTWVPVWGDEFNFPLTVPEIALLRVEVHQYDVSEKDVFGGQTVLPVWELRPGIRAVALYDRQGNRFDNVRLLMRFEFV